MRNPDTPVPAVVSSAVDLARLSHEWDLLEAREQKTLAEIRLAKDKLLLEARKAFPERGPRAKGWGDLLAKWKIDQATAFRYMKLAEGFHAECMKSGDVVVPTYEQAGITKPKPKVMRASADAEPMSAGERQALVDEQTAKTEALRQERLAPQRMEARQSAVADVLAAYEHCIETLNRLHERGHQLADCTSSPADFATAKYRVFTLFAMVETELQRAHVALDERPAAPARQLTLVSGGKE